MKAMKALFKIYRRIPFYVLSTRHTFFRIGSNFILSWINFFARWRNFVECVLYLVFEAERFKCP